MAERQTRALRDVLKAVVDEHPQVRSIYEAWRRVVAEDTAAELAERNQVDLLCGPFPAECDGRVRIQGIGVDCPLAGNCEIKSRRAQ